MTGIKFDILKQANTLRANLIQLQLDKNHPDYDERMADWRYEAQSLGNLLADHNLTIPSILQTPQLLYAEVSDGYDTKMEILERDRNGSKDAWNALSSEERSEYTESFHEMCARGTGEDHRFYRLLMDEHLGRSRK